MRKETEENNRTGKTRDLFKEIRDTEGTFHVKMYTVKDRNGMDLTEAEDIKEEVARIHRRTIQKRSYDPDNHDDVTTHLEPDILECEVRTTINMKKTKKETCSYM